MRISTRLGRRYVGATTFVVRLWLSAYPVIAAPSMAEATRTDARRPEGTSTDEVIRAESMTAGQVMARQSGEQADVAPSGESSADPREPETARPAACCGLHRLERLMAGSFDDKTPWTAADIVSGEDLSRLISSSRGVKPVILQIGIEVLYKDAHIPDAIYAGPASEPEGLALLKAKARRIAHNREIVIYCGCCPWENCPNIRPAFLALQQMGFSKVKLLSIPNDFQQDWVNKGFPTVRS